MDKIIEVEQLADNQWRTKHLPENWLIIELSPQDVFNAGHIQGSVHLDYKLTQPGTMPEPGGMLDKARVSELFSQLGISHESFLILSDYEGGGWAGRFAWLLDMLGHQHYSYLNGGLRAWQGANLPLTTDLTQITPSQYRAHSYHQAHRIDKDSLLEQLGQDNLVIWDARSPAEYAGSKANSAFAGHIPHAIHYEWTELMDNTRHLRLKPLDEIKRTLANLGIDERKTVVTYCQSHHRSGLTYMVGRLLGLNIIAYAGGWAEWGNDPDTPKTTLEK